MSDDELTRLAIAAIRERHATNDCRTHTMIHAEHRQCHEDCRTLLRRIDELVDSLAAAEERTARVEEATAELKRVNGQWVEEAGKLQQCLTQIGSDGSVYKTVADEAIAIITHWSKEREATAELREKLAVAERQRDLWQKDSATWRTAYEKDEVEISGLQREAIELRAECERKNKRLDEFRSAAERDDAVRRQIRGMMKEAGVKCYFGKKGAIAVDGFPRDLQDCVKDLIAERDCLRQQLADAQRPIPEGEPMATIEDFQIFVQRERAARVAAEERERTLREFVRTQIIVQNGKPYFLAERAKTLSDDDLDKLLADFAAKKGGEA